MMKSIGAKISYVLLLVFLVCCVGIIIVNSKINGMEQLQMKSVRNTLQVLKKWMLFLRM